MNSAKRSSLLHTPWDAILGTKSQVRILRVLEATRESMAVRELARRAGEHLRSVQLAVGRLVQTGVVERVGTGTHQQVRINEHHPLTAALHALFQAERERLNVLVKQLKTLVKQHASRATAVWARGRESPDSEFVEVGVLAKSEEVDGLADALRSAVVDLMREQDVTIEVGGWTEADLAAVEGQLLPDGDVILLRGRLPDQQRTDARSRGRRSHAEVDEELLSIAKFAASALKKRPELAQHALDEVQERLRTASRQESKTLQEWRDVLDGMTVPRLCNWLVSRSERATRLRQSLPMTFARAAQEHARSPRVKKR